uniref:Uncharacterized protein n=1 Tax=Oryza brachyantha TaxID=4533 RepID=J3LEH5_ORYBR
MDEHQGAVELAGGDPHGHQLGPARSNDHPEPPGAGDLRARDDSGLASVAGQLLGPDDSGLDGLIAMAAAAGGDVPPGPSVPSIARKDTAPVHRLMEALVSSHRKNSVA